MPTVILPTKDALKAYTQTPFQFLKDSAAETWLIETNNYDFLLKLMAAWRNGAHSFTYWLDTSYTDVLFITNVLTHNDYGYGYTVSNITGYDSTHTALPVPAPGLGNDAVRWSFLVSWA